MLFFIITIGIIAAVLGIAVFTKFELSDEQYDRLKWLVMKWDYIVVFLGLIVKVFNVPHGLETVTIVGGIGALIAGLIGVSAKNYYTTSEQSSFNEESLTEMMGVSVEEGEDED